MKKPLAIFSVLIYFAFTCGVMINMHYCMNRLDSVKLYAEKSDYCGKCGMYAQKHGCCHDEVSIVKIDDDHHASQFNFASEAPVALATILSDFILPVSGSEQIEVDQSAHPPPLLTEQDTYLQNCVFRI
jgi:hypothetical protein